MDYALYSKLRKGNIKGFQELCTVSLRKMWFICYSVTGNVSQAAPLFVKCWGTAVEKTLESATPPSESFSALVSNEILKALSEKIESDDRYETLSPPVLPEQYTVLVNGIEQLDFEERALYLLTTFGEMNVAAAAALKGDSVETVKETISLLDSKVKNIPAVKSLGYALTLRLSTELKSPDGSPFLSIEFPDLLVAALEHDSRFIMQKHGKTAVVSNVGKEAKNMKTSVNQPQKPAAKNKRFKYTKSVVTSAVCLVAVLVLAFVLPKVFGGNTVSTRVVTYNVDQVSYGNVTQTISGSGTLTPVTKETLTSSSGGEVEEVNFTVGDEVEEDDVIAVIDDEEIVAPCDGILLELPIAVGDEVAVGGSVAMVMGKDGFTMGIAVDETEISSVAIGQEVSFTVDAVSGEYTGKVTKISYNGSSSGGSVAFQITASVEYAEGVYPGMSASAQIVIEDSGEGLLVPVDAVRTSGDNNYVYLAPSGTEAGAVYEEGEIDVNDLTAVTVETGMSDGSYILIESDELAEGDLIVITKITSTLTGSESESEEGMGGFGGFGGMGGMGGFPGGGMDFGDFDFENFDPSQMPSGGMGGFGG